MTQKKLGGLPARKALAIVRPSVIATTFSGRSEKYFKLQRINAVLGGLYIVQAVLIWVLGQSAKTPIVLNYLAKDPLQTAAENKNVLALASHHWFDANVLFVTVLMLLLAGLFHGLLATALRQRYETGLARKFLDLRWGAYALIGGLMAILVGLVIGIADAAILVALFALAIVVSLGAMAIEANGTFRSWSVFGTVGMIAAALLLSLPVVGGMLYGSALSATGALALGLLTLGAVGAVVNLYLQVHKAREWNDYLFAEEGYMALNFITSSALVWVVFAGVLR